MRILVATDGSNQADRAVRFAGAQPWPDGTFIQVLVADDGQVVSREVLGGSPVVIDTYDARTEDVDEIARCTADSLRRPGWNVACEVIRGRAASVIVAEAARLEADLVIVGSRGRGPLGSLTLGSVSAEVVDHAGRPVLVARGEAPIKRVILADDGSDTAEKALGLVTRWPVFEQTVIGVVSVAHVSAPLHSAITPSVYWAAMEDYERSVEEAHQERDMILRDAAEALWAAGRSVKVLPREGDPAEQIVAAAVEQEADLIVTGSRGETGLSRVLLGSVARNVLYEASCSVLVVR